MKNLVPLVPVVSRETALVLSRLANPLPGLVLAAPVVTSAMVAEARRLLDAHERAFVPIAGPALAAWLEPLSVVLASAPREKALLMFAATAALALDDLPDSVLNQGTQREALRTWRFWPSAADLVALLAPHAQQYLARRDGLRTLAATRPPAPEAVPQPLTEAEQAAEDARILRGVRARMRGEEGYAPPPRPLDRAPTLVQATRPAGPQRTPAEQIAAVLEGVTAQQVQRAQEALTSRSGNPPCETPQ
ncbi:MAG: hypothetical protein NVS3B2_04640 [Ramlibacter sp.]